MTGGSPFDRLRARWLVMQFLLFIGGVFWLYDLLGGPAELGGDERLGAVLMYGALGLVLLVRGRFAGLNWRRLFGRWPARAQLPLLSVIVPVNLIALAAAMAVFIPLSYVTPAFVERWLLAPDELSNARSFPQWLGLVVVAAVAAPVVEELFFRGILLHRWARRWGTTPAVVASSALFGVLHADPLGAFLFGVAMCALYLRTRTLWMPILAHAVTNFALVLFGLSDALRPGAVEVETLESIRGDWPLGLLALATGLPLLVWYLRRYWEDGRLRATLAGPVPYDVYAASGTEPPDSTSAS